MARADRAGRKRPIRAVEQPAAAGDPSIARSPSSNTCRSAPVRVSAQARAGCSRSAACGARSGARRGRGTRASAGRASAPAIAGSTSRSLRPRRARSGDRVEREELEDPAQHAGGVADELLVGEDVHPLELLAVGLEERVTAEPVLEHPVVAAVPARSRGRIETGIGWRTMTTNAEPGKSAWRKRV